MAACAGNPAGVAFATVCGAASGAVGFSASYLADAYLNNDGKIDPDKLAEEATKGALIGGSLGLVGSLAGKFLGAFIKTITKNKPAPAAAAPEAAAPITSQVRHGPMNPGPLQSDVVETFSGGSYRATTSSEPTTLYRVYGGGAEEIGPYWTRTKPHGPVQSIIDSALNPAWGNNATAWTQIRVPAGVKIFEGTAAPQGGLVGGGSQVYIPKVEADWVVNGGTF